MPLPDDQVTGELRPLNATVPREYVWAEGQPGLLMTGIYAQTNDHYDLADGAAAPGCRRMLEVIETKWDWSIDNSAAIIDRLMALTETCGMKP